MQVTETFNMYNEDDVSEYQVRQQARKMLMALQDITGRYASFSDYEFGFKGLLKYDGLEVYTKKALSAAQATHKNDLTSAGGEITVDMVHDVVYSIVSDMEDAYYKLLTEYEIDLDD